MLSGSRMNERTLLALGVLLGVGSGKPPEEWLQSAHLYAREKQAEDPMKAVAFTVLAGAAAFYAAEREHNPKINSFYDALIYVSTNLSVGYSDVFAETEAGKAIGSALMAYGPALASRVFDLPNEARERVQEGERSEAALRDISDKLERILVELQTQRGGTAAHG
jgi:voltage-gated potassium channel